MGHRKQVTKFKGKATHIPEMILKENLGVHCVSEPTELTFPIRKRAFRDSGRIVLRNEVITLICYL